VTFRWSTLGVGRGEQPGRRVRVPVQFPGDSHHNHWVSLVRLLGKSARQTDLSIRIRPLYTSFRTSLIPEHLPRIKHHQ